MLAAVLFTLVLDTARDSFNLLLSVGAGTGLLYLLRWFWWRINAWSEIAAMASSFVLALAVFLASRRGIAWPSHVTLLATVALTTAVWLAVTWLTAPTDPDVLRRFYRAVRPAGPGWARVRHECDDLPSTDDLTAAFGGWLAGCACVYAALFATGHLIMGHTAWAAGLGLVFAVSAVALTRSLRRALA
jgi:hypothetical protein